MGPHMIFQKDAEAVKDTRLKKGALRRVWVFARPYRASINGFVLTIVLSALLSLVAPFAFRRIIDQSIPKRDRGLLTILAIIVVLAALGDAVVAIIQRW